MPRHNLHPPLCSCGVRTKIITSWTDANPGRRFAVCQLPQEEGCGFWEWYDPQMCQRSIEVIPGLLRRINRLEHGIDVADDDAGRLDSLVARLKEENSRLEEGLKKTKKKLRVMTAFAWIILGLLFCMCRWGRTTVEGGRNMPALEGC